MTANRRGKMNKKELYQSKVISLEEALSKIKSGDVIKFGEFLQEPQRIMGSLHTIADRVEDVKVWTGTVSKDYPFLIEESLRGIIDIPSTFYSAQVRTAHLQKRASYLPSFLYNTGNALAARGDLTVFIAAVPPMDEHGFVCLGGSQSLERECLEAADLVIFEVNPRLPVLYGDTMVPIEKVDYFVEAEYPLFELANPKITEVERRIGNYIAELVEDGSTLQLGVGAMPDAAGQALMDKKDLGIHTELITSAMGKLMRAGVVTNERKNFHRGKTIGAITWGDQELYDTLDRNPMVEMHRCHYVNDPMNVMKNDKMVSINAALEIDLTGQICSESIGARHFSGTGGAFDFAYGAYRSKGGKGIIAISSTAKGGTVSKIQPVLSPGAAVTISRNVADYIVTEYGVARLRDKTIGERVRELIAISHPDFREELQKQADEMMIW